MQQLGVKVLAIPDGDVAAALLCCLPDTQVIGYDVLSVVRRKVWSLPPVFEHWAVTIQARLLTRELVKSDSEEKNRAFAESEPPLSGNGSRGKIKSLTLDPACS